MSISKREKVLVWTVLVPFGILGSVIAIIDNIQHTAKASVVRSTYQPNAVETLPTPAPKGIAKAPPFFPRSGRIRGHARRGTSAFTDTEAARVYFSPRVEEAAARDVNRGVLAIALTSPWKVHLPEGAHVRGLARFYPEETPDAVLIEVLSGADKGRRLYADTRYIRWDAVTKVAKR